MSIRQVDIEEKREFERELSTDFYGERGCCCICDEVIKETMEGLQRDIWLNGKHYNCLCFECKCTKCHYYDKEEGCCTYDNL